MYRLRLLIDQEIIVGAAWKRFAISLSNLFAYEKDIKTHRLPGMPKLSVAVASPPKNMIDDGLRILARQKVDQSVPSLKVLSAMLNAYFSDLSSLPPSLEAYTDALENAKTLTSDQEDNQFTNRNTNLPMYQFLPGNLKVLRNANCNDAFSAYQVKNTKLKKISQLRQNEKFMKMTLHQFCVAVPIPTYGMEIFQNGGRSSRIITVSCSIFS